MKHQVRQLAIGDEAALEAFLCRHPESSMFLRSNLRRVALIDEGQPYQASYVAAFAGPAIIGVMAHCWNGMLLVQAPEAIDAIAPALVEASRRNIRGLSGPGDQVAQACQALGLDQSAAVADGLDELFALDLGALRFPDMLRQGAVVVRRPREDEFDRLADWAVGFHVEALGFAEDAALRRNVEEELRRRHDEAVHFVLVDPGDQPLSYAAFNATLPDMVQLGGVWTPTALRRRGFGRCVVAGALLAARDNGVERAILFTAIGNEAAKRAYLSLGFERVGSYGLVLFA